MKNFILAILCLFLYSCSSDDAAVLRTSTEGTCDCHYEVVENGELQQGYTEPSDTTDCALDGTRVYYEGWGENDTYYRVLKCNPKQ